MNPSYDAVNQFVRKLSGRLARFGKILLDKVDPVTAIHVLEGAEKYKQFKYPEKAAWWKGAVKRLESSAGHDLTVEIMKACGRKCCGIARRKTAKKLFAESLNMDDFLNKLNTHDIGGGRLKRVNDRTITGGYDSCLCGQVKYTETPFDDLTYCECSSAWFQQLFESALDQPVEVVVNQSIIAGDDTCEFTVTLSETVS